MLKSLSVMPIQGIIVAHKQVLFGMDSLCLIELAVNIFLEISN